MECDGPSGARPRLVCRTTPVALITRRRKARPGRERLPDRDFDRLGKFFPAQKLTAGGFDNAADLIHDIRVRRIEVELFEDLMDGRQIPWSHVLDATLKHSGRGSAW